MTMTDWITLAGATVTVLSMLTSILQARNAYRSSQAANAAMMLVQITSVTERLKLVQEHIRDIAPEKVMKRGLRVSNLVSSIRREFDFSLSGLPKAGLGGSARQHLTSAQTELNKYQNSTSTTPDPESWEKLQSFVQDAISDLTSSTSSYGAAK